MTRLRELQYSWERQKPKDEGRLRALPLMKRRMYITDLIRLREVFDSAVSKEVSPTDSPCSIAPLKVEFEKLYYVTPDEIRVWYNVICEGRIIDIIWRE